MTRSSNNKRAARNLQQTSHLTYQQALEQVRTTVADAESLPSEQNPPKPIEPPYGITGQHIEPAPIAAWGARAIIYESMLDVVDFVPDRQGTDGGPHSRHLLDLLNTRCPMTTMRALISAYRHAGALQFDQAGTVILYEDPQITIAADTNASYGYLYVTAWLRAVPHESAWFPPVPDPAGTDPRSGHPYWLDVIHRVNGGLAKERVNDEGFGEPQFVQHYREQDRLVEHYPSYDVMFSIRTVDINTGVVITPLTHDAANRLAAAYLAVSAKEPPETS